MRDEGRSGGGRADPARDAVADGESGQGDASGGIAQGQAGAATAPLPALDAVLRGLRDGRALQAMLAAILAWAITVAPAAFARGMPSAARAVAILALLAGVGAPPLALVRRRVARHVGISLFIALATLVWLLSSPALQPTRLDPVRTAIGAVAWGVFALSWRDRWPSGRQPEPDPEAPLLLARSHLPPLAAPIAAAGTLAALCLLFLAWRVREQDRAVLAQAVAVVSAVALITVSATVATMRGRRSASTTYRLTPHAVRPLLLLITFALAGAIVLMLR